jgi:Beta-propeller repeat
MYRRAASYTSGKGLVLLIAAFLLVAAGAAQDYRRPSALLQASASGPARPSRIVAAYGRLPLSFEANRGQADAQVKFLSRGSGYSLYLTSTEAVLRLRKPASQDRGPTGMEQAAAPEHSSALIRMRLAGANSLVRVEGLEELPGKSNYLIGNDPSRWRTNVPTYAKVRCENVYPGIDLVYYGNQQQLEYDFVVSPRADLRVIRLAFEGCEKMRINGQGDLVLETEGGEVCLHRPVVYQEVGGARQSVGGNYVIQRGLQVGFEVARYDAGKPLIIDPTLSYSTYLGGSSADQGFAIAVDSSGNAYVTGWTTSTDFPAAGAPFQTANGFPTTSDAFVTKLNAAGSGLIYSTYLGGSFNDYGSGIAVDSAGNAYVTGYTTSTDFPTMNPYQAAHGGDGGENDAFVTKLNATGSALVYSTYLGGSDEDWGCAIAVDSSGDAYVTGATVSPGSATPAQNFPTTSHAFQSTHPSTALRAAFVTEFNAAGSALIYSTYIGGSGDEGGTGIAVDSSGNAYVTGFTSTTSSSNGWPASTGGFQKTFGGVVDAFVTKFNPGGSGTKSLVYSTYLGGTGADSASMIALDSSGDAFVVGSTSSSDFPTKNPLQAANRGSLDAFVTEIDPGATGTKSFVYSTYLGGSGTDAATGIALDSSGNIYVTGYTASADFPLSNSFQAVRAGNFDAFLTKLNATGSALAYSSYLGGNDSEYGSGIAVDSLGNAYVTGTTRSTNFHTVNAFQPAGGGDFDAFVTKVAP